MPCLGSDCGVPFWLILDGKHCQINWLHGVATTRLSRHDLSGYGNVFAIQICSTYQHVAYFLFCFSKSLIRRLPTLLKPVRRPPHTCSPLQTFSPVAGSTTVKYANREGDRVL